MPSFQLVVRRGPRAGERFELKTQTVVIGRDSSADISINDPEVSRNHCRLILDRSYYIQDLGSTNGTFIDGKRLGGEPQQLVNGQIVQLGSNVTLLYHEADADEEEPPVLSTMTVVQERQRVETSPLDPSDADIIDSYGGDEPEQLDDMAGLEDLLAEGPYPEYSAEEEEKLALLNRQTIKERPASQFPAEEIEEDDNRRTYMIIAIVVGLLLLCCVCLGVIGVLAFLQSEGQIDLFGWHSLRWVLISQPVF